MKRRMCNALLLSIVIVSVLCLPSASGIPKLGAQNARSASGQTATLLPDGRWLLVGGDRLDGPAGAAETWNPRTQATTVASGALHYPRSWHTATMLPDGRILVLGGVGSGGQVLDTAELFDPKTETFELLPATGLAARAHHTATLLTDGRLLLAGGAGADGNLLAEAALW